MSHAKHRQIREICEIRVPLKPREIRGLIKLVLSGGCRDHLSMQLCMQKVLAMAVRTVMMKLMMVLMFSFFIVVVGLMVTQSCGGVIVHNLVVGLMVTQSGEKGYGGSEQVPVHDGVSLVLAGVITPVVSWCGQPGWSSEYP